MMEQQTNRQYFNDAQLYMLNMDCRDEVVVAGRGLGKGAIQARRLQSCFQGMPGSMGGFVAPSVKRCLTNILPSMLIHWSVGASNVIFIMLLERSLGKSFIGKVLYLHLQIGRILFLSIMGLYATLSVRIVVARRTLCRLTTSLLTRRNS